MGQFPPATLEPLGPRASRVASIIWWILFAVAAVAIIGGAWKGIAEHRAAEAFGLIGLNAQADPVSGCIVVVPMAPSAGGAWPANISPTPGGCIRAVDGRELPGFDSLASVARMLGGPEGSIVTLTLMGEDGATVDVRFLRFASNIPITNPPIVTWFVLGQLIAYTIVAILFAGVALLLRRRRRDDPVSILIAFAFVLMANIGLGAQAFWNDLGEPMIGVMAVVIGQALLIIAMPAFPNGVFVPRWSRWLIPLAPLVLIGLQVATLYVPENPFLTWFGGITYILVPGIALAMLLARYWRMPAGLQKQQVKWAVFGLSVGLLLATLTAVLPLNMEWAETHPDLFIWLAAISVIASVLGYVLMPVGVGISLLEYRLNDADAVISKSLGYAVVTIVVGMVWAVVASFVNAYVGRYSADPLIATAITTTIAALVFTPTRTKVLAWTEERFQRALVRLRSLPTKLSRWQTSETPEELAEQALDGIVEGVGASGALVIGHAAEGNPVLAAVNLEGEQAREAASVERPVDRREDPFPIRITLADKIGDEGELLVAPRSDGASYTRDERSALASIKGPLTDALRAARRRTRHTVELAATMEALEQRLAALESSAVRTPGA